MQVNETNTASAAPNNGSAISIVQDQRQANDYVFWQTSGGHIQGAITVPYPPQAVGKPFALSSALSGTRIASTALDGVSEALVLYQNNSNAVEAMTVNRNGAVLSTTDIF